MYMLYMFLCYTLSIFKQQIPEILYFNYTSLRLDFRVKWEIYDFVFNS